MRRKIVYWGATGLVAIVTLSAAFSYLTTAPEAVENFRHVGYPQQLRVLLGIGKLAGAIVLLLPAAASLEGMGLRRLHLHVDRGSRGALSGGRRGLVLAARCVARVRWRFRTSRARRIAAGPPRRCWRSAAARPPVGRELMDSTMPTPHRRIQPHVVAPDRRRSFSLAPAADTDGCPRAVVEPAVLGLEATNPQLRVQRAR